MRKRGLGKALIILLIILIFSSLSNAADPNCYKDKAEVCNEAFTLCRNDCYDQHCSESAGLVYCNDAAFEECEARCGYKECLENAEKDCLDLADPDKDDGTCYDGIFNQGEQEVDCGGPCPPCASRDKETGLTKTEQRQARLDYSNDWLECNKAATVLETWKTGAGSIGSEETGDIFAPRDVKDVNSGPYAGIKNLVDKWLYKSGCGADSNRAVCVSRHCTDVVEHGMNKLGGFYQSADVPGDASYWSDVAYSVIKETGKYIIEVVKGEVYIRTYGNDFLVKVPNGAARFQSEGLVKVNEDGLTEIYLFEGEVEYFSSEDGSFNDVDENEFLYVNEIGQVSEPEEFDVNELDKWWEKNNGELTDNNDLNLTESLFWLFAAFVLFPISIVFWIWMLIDCIVRKNIDRKGLWIVLIIIFGVIASLIYFFTERKRAKISDVKK